MVAVRLVEGTAEEGSYGRPSGCRRPFLGVGVGVDGLSAIQSRIAEIQGAFAVRPRAAGQSSGDWASVAAAAGLPPPTSAAAPSGAMPGAPLGARAASNATTYATTPSAPSNASSPTSPPTSTELSVTAAAQKYLGVPYRWGGTDPATGLDCSGFTRRVFADLGINLPRTSAQQATAGVPVASLASARPGDLLFYDYDTSRPGIDHVGVYVGNGRMIAAPTEGQSVKIQSVGTPTLIRRVLPAGPPAGVIHGGTRIAKAAGPPDRSVHPMSASAVVTV